MLSDWDRAEHRGVVFPCRYEEEYSAELGVQGVSRTLLVSAKRLEDIGQGDTIDRVCTVDHRVLGPFTVETRQRDTGGTASLRLRGA